MQKDSVYLESRQGFVFTQHSIWEKYPAFRGLSGDFQYHVCETPLPSSLGSFKNDSSLTSHFICWGQLHPKIKSHGCLDSSFLYLKSLRGRPDSSLRLDLSAGVWGGNRARGQGPAWDSPVVLSILLSRDVQGERYGDTSQGRMGRPGP